VWADKTFLGIVMTGHLGFIVASILLIISFVCCQQEGKSTAVLDNGECFSYLTSAFFYFDVDTMKNSSVSSLMKLYIYLNHIRLILAMHCE